MHTNIPKGAIDVKYGLIGAGLREVFNPEVYRSIGRAVGEILTEIPRVLNPETSLIIGRASVASTQKDYEPTLPPVQG